MDFRLAHPGGAVYVYFYYAVFFVHLYRPRFVSPRAAPTTLAVTIAANRENVPFPPIIEAMVMEITIESLREAGLRLPSPLGQTIGLVGGVVIGQVRR
nr:spore germination protein [Bacillus velezensis]